MWWRPIVKNVFLKSWKTKNKPNIAIIFIKVVMFIISIWLKVQMKTNSDKFIYYDMHIYVIMIHRGPRLSIIVIFK